MSGAARHKHFFSALSYCLGPYGPQDVHIHPCIEGEVGCCERVIVGEGRRCSGKKEDHRRRTLTEEGLKR